MQKLICALWIAAAAASVAFGCPLHKFEKYSAPDIGEMVKLIYALQCTKGCVTACRGGKLHDLPNLRLQHYTVNLAPAAAASLLLC